MRKEFEMSRADYDGILAKIKEAQNTPLIMLQTGMPTSPLEAANRAWCELGKRLGFEGMSVRPIEGKGQLFFTAEATEKPATSIQLTPAEIRSGLDRVRWAEGLIRQLPEDHDGRNSWLLNYGTKPTPVSR